LTSSDATALIFQTALQRDLSHDCNTEHVSLLIRGCPQAHFLETQKHKNIPFPSTNSRKVLNPIHRHKMQKYSFAHTFCAKIKQGQLQKGSASTTNPKKEHHHGGAVRLV
jgi:hypothetical protein